MIALLPVAMSQQGFAENTVAVYQGNENEYYSCDECKAKTAATINMRIHRFPRILMLHIKRFTYTGGL